MPGIRAPQQHEKQCPLTNTWKKACSPIFTGYLRTRNFFKYSALEWNAMWNYYYYHIASHTHTFVPFNLVQMCLCSCPTLHTHTRTHTTHTHAHTPLNLSLLPVQTPSARTASYLWEHASTSELTLSLAAWKVSAPPRPKLWVMYSWKRWQWLVLQKSEPPQPNSTDLSPAGYSECVLMRVGIVGGGGISGSTPKGWTYTFKWRLWCDLWHRYLCVLLVHTWGTWGHNTGYNMQFLQAASCYGHKAHPVKG